MRRQNGPGYEYVQQNDAESSRSAWAIAYSWAIIPPIETPSEVEALELERVDEAGEVLGHLPRSCTGPAGADDSPTPRLS